MAFSEHSFSQELGPLLVPRGQFWQIVNRHVSALNDAEEHHSFSNLLLFQAKVRGCCRTRLDPKVVFLAAGW